MKPFRRICPLLFLLVIFFPRLSAQNHGDLNDYVNKIGQTLYYMQHYYLDTLSVEQAVDRMLQTAMEDLDPHSVYIPARDVEKMNEALEGNFEGIGVEFILLHDSLVVVNALAGGPSESVGIRSEDRIVSVDGQSISGPELNNEKVFSLLRGPKGTPLRLGVVRKGVGEVLYFDLIRDRIPINSIDVVYEAAPGIAYVKLSRFAITSMQEFISVFDPDKTFKTKPKALILDLRGNSGGYLLTALQLAEQFLSKGNLMLYTEGAHQMRHEEKARRDGFYKNEPVAVLIDEYSASASEILSGALQDWDRGIIIGRRSFGKGLVQQVMPLNDGSQLRLTVARYHTPSGRVIQSPYEKGKREAYYAALQERYTQGEFFTQDSIHLRDSLSYKTLRTGRTVYGGGGIMPDIFVPADTSYFSPFYEKLLRSGVIRAFMDDYTDKVVASYTRKYKTFERFDASFGLDRAPLDELLAYAATKDIIPSDDDLQASGRHLRLQLKALIARRIFDTQGYYRIVNRNDPCYRKALEVLENWERYAALLEPQAITPEP